MPAPSLISSVFYISITIGCLGCIKTLQENKQEKIGQGNKQCILCKQNTPGSSHFHGYVAATLAQLSPPARAQD